MNGHSGTPILASVPWLLGAAGLLSLATVRSPTRRTWPTLAALAALTAAALLGRWHLVPFNFFHQNGHGPEQLARVVLAVSTGYGPGLHELGHGVIGLFPRDPEAAFSAVQSVLAALAPAAAWKVARAVGARGLLPWALALAVALDPMLARLTRSESYLGAGTSLVFLAMALVAHAGLAPRRTHFLYAALAAGAVVAQAARIHPWIWAATATAPVVPLLARGAWRRRLRSALALAGLIAVVTLLTSGRAMWAASHNDLSARYSGMLLGALPRRLGSPLLVGLATVVVLARNRRSAALAALAAGLALTLFAVADLPAATDLRPWIHGAYARLYLPAWVALVARALRDVGSTPARRRAAAACGLALVLGPAAARWSVERTIPTDAREQALARGWRQSLPSDEAVMWLATAGPAVLRLPIYAGDDPLARRVLPASPENLVHEPPDERRPRYYYRSSLCAMEVGASACARFEATHRLTPLATWSLPATPNYFVPYLTPTVRVGLYRID